MPMSAKDFFFSIIVIAHLVFLLNWIYYFLQEGRSTIRNRLPKFYTSVFLCCKPDKLKKELEIQ